MCTLIAAFQVWPDLPLVVAANRDEFLARPAIGPFLWPGSPRFVAPRDEVAGGTWLGLNEYGLFVALTNRPPGRPDPSRRSRGELVANALHARSAAALHEQLLTLDPERYSPFHLFCADRSSAHLTVGTGTTVEQSDLSAGLHIITDRSPRGIDTPRGAWIQDFWSRRIADRPVSVEGLRSLLSEHNAHEPRDGTCLHFDAIGYGTRSSTILWLGRSAFEDRLFWAEGPPCKTPYEDRSDLLEALRRA